MDLSLFIDTCNSESYLQYNVTKHCYRYNKGIEGDHIYPCHDSNEIGIVSSHVSDKKKRGFHNKQLKHTRISQRLPESALSVVKVQPNKYDPD